MITIGEIDIGILVVFALVLIAAIITLLSIMTDP